MLEALRCRFCGGFIDRHTFTCQYCGTVYMRPREPYNIVPRELIVVREAPLITYKASVAVDDHIAYYDPQFCESHVRSQLAYKLSEAVAEHMALEEEHDPYSMQNIYQARLRIVKPDYKWGT